MKIAITGATGFVGRNLSEYLNPEHEITRLNIRYVQNQKIKINEDVVIHLAGKAHDLKKVSVPQDYYEANFELTKQLFDAFLISDTSVFIFMSTVKAVADKVDGVLTEDSIPNPKTHYGISKLQAEEYILSKEIPKSKRVFILRPCMIHGPGNKGNLNILYKFVEKNLPWPLGSFQNQRSFLSIENLCFVIKELLENKTILSGIYHIADDTLLSTNELIEILGESLDKKSNIWSIPIFYIKSVARIGDIFNLPLNSERLEKLTENYRVSNNKISKAMRKSLPASTNEGLIKTFKSFKIKI